MGIFDSDYDFNKYKVFYAVATMGSFSKAAEVLHISQPAISYSIKELENQLDTKLFIRNKNGLILTDDANRLKEYVKKAFDNILLGQELIGAGEKDFSSLIRIGIYAHIGSLILPEIISDYKKKHTNIEFYIYSTSNEEMITKLKNRELDMLIVLYPSLLNEKNYKEEYLFSLNTCFYSNKDYYDMFIKNNYLFKDIPLILPQRGFPDITNFEKTMNSKKIKYKRSITSYAEEVSIGLVEQGLGVAWGLEKNAIKHNLYKLPIKFDIPKSEFSIIYNDKIINDACNNFISYLKNNIEKYTK